MHREVIVDEGGVHIGTLQHLHGNVATVMPGSGVFSIRCMHGEASDQDSFPADMNGVHHIRWPSNQHGRFAGEDRLTVGLSFSFTMGYELIMDLHNSNCIPVQRVKHIRYQRQNNKERYQEFLAIAFA
jgi:hypothetical protein